MPCQAALAVGPALYCPQQDSLGLNNIFLVVETSVQLLLKRGVKEKGRKGPECLCLGLLRL